VAKFRIGAIVLAAGASTRFGLPKQLQIHDNLPLVRRAAIAVLDAGVSRVFVVLGSHANAIAPALSGLPSLTIVPNPNWERGLASSLAVGVSTASADPFCDAVLVTLADQPLVDAHALQRLITSFDNDHRIVASAYDSTIGVPALFGREHFGDLMCLTGDHGAGSWLRQRASSVTSVPLPSASLDIDSPSDMTRLMERIS
jgi:molybdenum cofactor cytidylyltransferase